MTRGARLACVAMLAASATTLSSCVAAGIPAVAAGALAKRDHDRAIKRARERRGAQVARQGAPLAPGTELRTPDGTVVVTGLKELPPPSGNISAGAVPAPAGAAVPPGMQFLYGSGEGAAIGLQTYQALWQYLRIEIGYRRDKSQIQSVILSPGSTLASPKFDLCGARPLAVVLDVDETALLNLGFESDDAVRRGPYDEARWQRWEASGAGKVAPVPGAAEALAQIRGAGFTVIFNTNRTNAEATKAALEGAGLGPVTIGDTLIVRGPGEPSGKDQRRWQIARKYCVVAMVGDQLGDFSDLFNDPSQPVAVRRNSASQTMLAALWGAGWFMLPNPVYGSALKGGRDDVFPKDKQWADPAEEK